MELSPWAPPPLEGITLSQRVKGHTLRFFCCDLTVKFRTEALCSWHLLISRKLAVGGMAFAFNDTQIKECCQTSSECSAKPSVAPASAGPGARPGSHSDPAIWRSPAKEIKEPCHGLFGVVNTWICSSGSINMA